MHQLFQVRFSAIPAGPSGGMRIPSPPPWSPGEKAEPRSLPGKTVHYYRQLRKAWKLRRCKLACSRSVINGPGIVFALTLSLDVACGKKTLDQFHRWRLRRAAMKMSPEHQLNVAMTQLRWSLAQPRVNREWDSFGRVCRALAFLSGALARHVALSEVEQVAATRFSFQRESPLRTRARESYRLRKQHEELYRQTKDLVNQFRSAISLLPELNHSIPGDFRGATQELSSLQTLHDLERRARDLLCALDGNAELDQAPASRSRQESPR